MLSHEVIDKYRYNAQGLADYFASDYYETHDKVFPLNPFQVLTDCGIHFVFRRFDKLEGLFLPATDENEMNLVAFNADRLITRQRFTAAHELCHYLKDSSDNSFMCTIASNDEIERFAEAFASAFLMPKEELEKQILKIRHGSNLTMDDVLIIADYFGTSFQACYYRIRALFQNVLPADGGLTFRKYKPDKKRMEFGLTYTNLYFDLFDAWKDIYDPNAAEFARHVFKHRYVFNDARLEKVETSYEATAEIIEDLQNARQLSRYCSDQYEYYCHVAGHSLMYDYVYEHADDENFSIYAISSLNAKLFSCFPNPEYGGRTRQSNPIVLGAKFETLDWREVMPAVVQLNDMVVELDRRHDECTKSELIKAIASIHHQLTVIHPFSDGNGRTSRAFMNAMLIRYNMAPLYIKLEQKEEYLNALECADENNNLMPLCECIMRSVIQTHVELADAAY